MIAIVDLGLGNAASIANILRHIGISGVRTAAADEIKRANRLILPGVGAFDEGMRRLNASGLVPLLEDRVREGVPVLGICLGMQLMTRRSEEGKLPGLGWVKADTRRFAFDAGTGLRVPHMGWNEVSFRSGAPLGRELNEHARFYFVHSYHVVLDRPAEDFTCHTTYGYEFVSGFQVGNVLGVQFHPEKSHRFGMQLYRNFSTLPTPCSRA